MTTVDWGDGTSNSYTIEVFPTHTYNNTEVKVYTISVAGTINQFGYTETAQVDKNGTYKDYYTFTEYLTGIESWGELRASRYGFSNCKNLTGSIPLSTENSFVNVTSMENLFYMCSSLTGTIPSNLFASGTNITSFANTFYGCEKLSGMIPEKLFYYKPKVTTYEGMFEGCKAYYM